MHYLTRELREKLKKPFGELIGEKEFLARLAKRKKEEKLFVVGDVCLLTALRAGIVPDLALYDFKSLRQELSAKERGEISGQWPEPVKVKSPAGMITPELEEAIVRGIRDGEKHAIFVEGEEDLSTLIVLAHAPGGSIVAYGQPNEGLVWIRVDAKTRETAGKLLAQMSPVPC